MNRRTLLSTVPMLVLVACTNGTVTPSQLQTDAQLIAAGIAAVVPIALGIKTITPADANAINQANAVIQSASQAIVAAASADVTLSVKTLVSAVQGLAPLALQYLPSGTPYAAAIQAAVALIPIILSAAGITMAVRAAPTMAPDEARLILKGMAGK